MAMLLEAACGCDKGRIRKNNEDNFFFAGACLPAENDGLAKPAVLRQALKQDLCLAVFDGMGGENFGEIAACAAAERLRDTVGGRARVFEPYVDYVTELILNLNDAVVEKAVELRTEHMGATVAALFFHRDVAYVSNLGDSRAYRLRDGALEQLTEDHVERRAASAPRKKSPLTQHLGIPSEVLRMEPYMAKGAIERGDQYLLCSDGLTDMLEDAEIQAIMRQTGHAAECVQRRIQAALENGGRDNVTAIVCRIL